MTLRGSILLVDDEEKILKALGRALRAAGHEVIETTSPRDAQRLLEEGRRAAGRGDQHALKEAVRAIWNLLPFDAMSKTRAHGSGVT